MKNKKGFTLVELLAVIVILALVMGIAVVSMLLRLLQRQRDMKHVTWEYKYALLNLVRWIQVFLGHCLKIRMKR